MTFRYDIDGLRLERWFLKTLINVGASTPATTTWAISGSPLDSPPLRFVEAAFGHSRLEQPLGLYGVGTVGEQIRQRGGLELRTLLDTNGTLVGALITFVGFRFLLLLQTGEVPPTASLPSPGGWATSGLLYHIERINVTLVEPSHFVQFDWTAT